MKKKLLSFVMALLIVPCAFMLMACGSPKGVEGKYKIESISSTAEGQTTTITKDNIDSEIAKADPSTVMMLTIFKQLFDSADFEFKADGNFTVKMSMSMGGETTQESTNGTWVLNEGQLTMTSPNEDPAGEPNVVNGTFKDGKITISDDGAMTGGVPVSIVLKRA